MTYRVWLVTLTSLLLACPEKKEAVDAGVDAGPVQLNETEPNDQPDKALVLSESSVVTANLGSDPAKPDEDWYVLTATSPKTVRLEVTGIPGADLGLEFQDEARNRMALVNSEGLGKGERVPNVHVKDKVFFKVYPAKKGAGGGYTLTAVFEETISGFELEPNDRAVDATVVPLGESVRGYVGHVADEDWFRFQVAEAAQEQPAVEPVVEAPGAQASDAGEPAVEVPVAESLDAGEQAAEVPVAEASDAGEVNGGLGDAGVAAQVELPQTALKIDLSAVENVRFEVSVLSAAEAPLFEIKGKDGEGLSLRNIGVRAADDVVYVVVKSAWTGVGKEARRTFNVDTSYSLKVAQEEAGANAELEPNRERDKATPLPMNGFREGFLSPKGDTDYFVLRTAEPVLARVQLSGVENVDLQLYMVGGAADGGEAEVELLRANDGAVKEPEMLNNVYCVGECFFRVEGVRKKIGGKWVADYENADQPYRLSVTTLPDNGSEEREPNNVATNAMAVSLGKAVRGTIYPKRDVDLYRLDLSDRPVRTALNATLLGVLKVDVGLYLYRVEEDGKLSLVQTSDRAKGEKPETIRYSAEPGVYVFEVKDSRKWGESNFQDSYQLTITEGE